MNTSIALLSIIALLVKIFGRKNLVKATLILIDLRIFKIAVLLFIVFLFVFFSIVSFRAGLIMTFKKDSFYVGLLYFMIPEVLFTSFCIYYYHFCFGSKSIVALIRGE